MPIGDKKGGFNFPGYDPLEVADAPALDSVTPGDNSLVVAFTAPSNTGGGAITSYQASIEGTQPNSNVSNSTYTSNSFNVSSYESNIGGGDISSDGTKFYITGGVANKVHYFTLSSAFDISSASATSDYTVSEDGFPKDVKLKSDGTKMFVLGGDNNSVYQYSLSSAYNVSTASYDSVSFSHSSQTTAETGFFIRADGLKFYIVDSSGYIYQYSMSSAWNMATASYDSVSYNTGLSNKQGISFNTDGTSFVTVVGSGTDYLKQYDLSTAWNVSTASATTGGEFDVSSQTNDPRNVLISNDNTKLYVITSTCYEYDCSFSPLSFTGTSSPLTITGLSNGTSYNVRVWAINDYGPSFYGSGSGTPALQRGLFLGGNDSGGDTNRIQYISIPSTGNATDFGDLTVTRRELGAVSSSTRACAIAGSAASESDVIDYVTVASTGNATDFGDLTDGYLQTSAASNGTRAVVAAGNNGSNTNIIEYFTIASTGNASDFGDLTNTQRSSQCLASSTRWVRCGGFTNIMDYVTIASTGNAVDFGDLAVYTSPYYLSSGNITSGTRGIIAPVTNNSGFQTNVIQYITIASTGNATGFGDLVQARNNSPGVCSSTTRGIVGGGGQSGRINAIDYFTIASTGNATDFGDLLEANQYLSGASNCHGGLS